MAKTETVDAIAELEVLFPDNNEVWGYKVKKYCVGDFKRAIVITSRNAALFGENIGPYLMTAGVEVMDDIIELILFSTNIPADVIDGMELDTFIEILVKIFEVNITFFSQSVVSAMATLKASQEDGAK
jgi:hypothetical protein